MYVNESFFFFFLLDHPVYLPTDATMVICHLTVCHVGKGLFLLQTDRQGFDTVGFCLCLAMSDTQNILQPLHSLQNPLIHCKKENVIMG